MSKYELVIFDCDGTLVNTEDACSMACVNVIQSMGIDHCTLNFFKDNLTGVSTDSLTSWVRNELGYDFDTKIFINKVRAQADAYMSDISIPGVQEMLSRLQHDKVVASNGVRHRVIKSLEKADIKSFFPDETIFTSEQVYATKPAPDLFLLASSTFATPIEKAIVLEDSIVGVTAANNANIDVVVYINEEKKNDKYFLSQLKLCKVKAIIDHHTQLLDLL